GNLGPDSEGLRMAITRCPRCNMVLTEVEAREGCASCCRPAVPRPTAGPPPAPEPQVAPEPPPPPEPPARRRWRWPVGAAVLAALVLAGGLSYPLLTRDREELPDQAVSADGEQQPEPKAAALASRKKAAEQKKEAPRPKTAPVVPRPPAVGRVVAALGSR